MSTRLKRRRRASVPKASTVDPGTPETAAKRVWPIWNQPGMDDKREPLAWPKELQEAAASIDVALRLVAGGSLAQAQNLLHIRHRASEEPPDWEKRLLRRYTFWRWEVVRHRIHLGRVIEAITGVAPCRDQDELKAALILWVTAPRSAWY